MKKRLFIAVLIVLVNCLLSANSVETDTLLCGIRHSPPFVFIEGEAVRGFSIDLIEMLAEGTNPPVVIEYKVFATIQKQHDAVASGKVDMEITSTTITSQREEFLDFSHPILFSSMGIMTTPPTKRLNILKILFDAGIIQTLLSLLVYIFICGNIIWLIERHSGNKAFNLKYIRGIFAGMWWTIVTMSTVGYGDVFPKRRLGKIFASLVIISGIAFFGIAVARLTSMMTVIEIQSEIKGIEDLYNRRVSVIEKTESVRLAHKYGTNALLAADINQAAQQVISGETVAFIHDLPIIKHYILTNPDKDLYEVPRSFEPFSYGISFKRGSPYRERFNISLLRVIETGVYDELTQKWFGGL